MQFPLVLLVLFFVALPLRLLIRLAFNSPFFLHFDMDQDGSNSRKKEKEACHLCRCFLPSHSVPTLLPPPICLVPLSQPSSPIPFPRPAERLTVLPFPYPTYQSIENLGRPHRFNFLSYLVIAFLLLPHVYP